jgi:separase
MTSTVSYHVEEAYKVLRGLIPSSSNETNPKAKKLPKEAAPAKKPVRAASVRTNKARMQNPVTPRPRKGLSVEYILAVVTDNDSRAALENVSNVIRSTPPKVAATNDVQKSVIVFDLESIISQLRKFRCTPCQSGC